MKNSIAMRTFFDTKYTILAIGMGLLYLCQPNEKYAQFTRYRPQKKHHY